MTRYIVRVWVDLVIEADDKQAAKKIANKTPIKVPKVEVYDMQVADVWTREAQ